MIEEFTRLLMDLSEKSTADILIGCIGQIESHNTERMTADVKPLLFFTSENKRSDYAVIPDVPVLFVHAGGYVIRPKYKRGDLVWVTFATYDIAAPLENSPADSHETAFSRENAAVICGLAGKKFKPGIDFDDDGIIIAHESGSMVFHLSENKIKAKVETFEVEGNVKVSGQIQAGQEITWMAAGAPTKASTHIHDTPVGPSSPPTPGS